MRIPFSPASSEKIKKHYDKIETFKDLQNLLVYNNNTNLKIEIYANSTKMYIIFLKDLGELPAPSFPILSLLTFSHCLVLSFSYF
jgi:hypothetical protein